MEGAENDPQRPVVVGALGQMIFRPQQRSELNSYILQVLLASCISSESESLN